MRDQQTQASEGCNISHMRFEQDEGSDFVSRKINQDMTTLNRADNGYATPDAEKGFSDSAETVSTPSDPSSERSTTLRIKIVIFFIIFANFLAALDSSIITTALPTISEHFHSSAAYTWIGSSYLLAAAAFVPTWGKLSDIWGRKNLLLLALVVFFVGSLLAGLSVNLPMLIAARAVQGIGGGGIINLNNICISDLFSMRERGKYLGMVGFSWFAAGALGPLIGGGFSQKLSWRWCFYINLPLTAVAFVALAVCLELKNESTSMIEGLLAVDWLGTLTMVGGTLMFLLGLQLGGVFHPWNSSLVICLIVFGIVAYLLFILVESHFAQYPIIPLRLFKHSSNFAALGVCFFQSFVYTGGLYFLPLYFQTVLLASPVLSGVYFLPYGLAGAVIEVTTGILIAKTGRFRPWMWIGLILMTLGTGLYIRFGVSPNWAELVIYQIIAGIGIGTNYQSPVVALQCFVDRGDVATANAMMGFTRLLSQAVSVVIGGVIFANQIDSRSGKLIDALGSDVASQFIGASVVARVDRIKALPTMQKDIVRKVVCESFRVLWIVYVGISALGLVTGFLVKQKKLETKHTIVVTGLKAENEKRAQFAQRGQR